MTSCLSFAPPSTGGFTVCELREIDRFWWGVYVLSLRWALMYPLYCGQTLHRWSDTRTAQPICNTCINGIYNHHGTPTLFLMNFTKTVKLTKTPITCHYRGWNSFSCDHLKNHENYWKVDFQINMFGVACLELHVRTVFIARPYCNASKAVYKREICGQTFSRHRWLAPRSLQSKTP